MKLKSLPITTLRLAFIGIILIACGDEVSEDSFLLDFASANSHCSEKVPGPDLPQTYCKTLSDGEVFSITLKASTYNQDLETCVVTLVDDGIKGSILEMGFEVCELD